MTPICAVSRIGNGWDNRDLIHEVTKVGWTKCSNESQEDVDTELGSTCRVCLAGTAHVF